MRAVNTSKGIVYMFNTKAEFDLMVREEDNQLCFITETLEWYKGRKLTSDPTAPIRNKEINPIITAMSAKNDIKTTKKGRKKK